MNLSVSGSAISGFAQTFNGAPYVYGGTSPSGWDCSGFVQYVYKHFGIDLPRTSEQQWQATQHIPASQLAPGDLVFAQFPGDSASPGHVGIYIGNGKVISAQDPQLGTGVSTLQSWGSAIVGYGRPTGTVNSGSPGSPASTTSPASAANVVSGATSLLSESGTLLHDSAQVLNAVFFLFQPGEQWRLVFGATGIVSLFSAVRLYMSDSSGEKMPLIVLLSGISATAFYMAFRPWPTSGGSSNAPIRPAAYVTDIFSGNVPSSAAKPPNDTAAIEAGLAAFAGVWAVSKTAGALSGIGGTVGGILGLFRNAGTVAEEG